MTFKYSIGLSFSSKKRRLVRNIANELSNKLGGQKHVFFDEYHPSAFQGPNAEASLAQIYKDECELIVPVFHEYPNGGWTGPEWNAIQTRIGNNGVLPVNLDGNIPSGFPRGGLPIDGRRKTGRQIASEILQYLEGEQHSTRSGNVGEECSRVEIGFIVVADIWDFSTLPPAFMERIIDALWESAEFAGMSLSLAAGLLDGIAIAIRQSNYSDLVAKCERWMKRFEQMTTSIGKPSSIRLALHRGDFFFLASRKLLVGSGPNECSRLVRKAGPKQIVLSEEFVKGWKTNIGWRSGTPLAELFPEADKDPMGMQIKAGTQSFFRFYKFGLDDPVFFASMKQADQAQQVLMQLINEVEDEFVDLVTDESDSIRADQVRARVSIFVPDLRQTDASRLIATEFRYARPQSVRNAKQTLKIGPTSYDLIRNGRPEGAIGHAFVEKDVAVIKNLPTYRESPNSSYVRELSTHWNIAPEKVRGFQRKARCFIAVPCWLNNELPHAEAVICIDTMHPLTDVSESFLRDCGGGFGRYFGSLIAALLWIRS